MEKILHIFSQLKSTNSRIEKENILVSNKDNEDFKYILNFLLDSNVTTGISTKKINKPIAGYEGKTYAIRSFDTFIDLLEYIKGDNTGTDRTIQTCKCFINTHTDNEELKEFYREVITKSLKCGVDVKTANKVYGKGFVFQFSCQLGTPIDKCKIPDGEWFCITRKLNGTRCIYYKGQLWTRQGKLYSGLQHIINEIKCVLGFDRDMAVLDGELVGKNENGLSDSENFQKSCGLANSKNADKSSLKFVIFDLITKNEFERGYSRFDYAIRNYQLRELKQQIADKELSNIEIVEMMYKGKDKDEIWNCLDKAESLDYEGIMINLDTPYVCKRTKNLIKVKKFFDCDIKCIDVEEGTGRNKHTLGAIVCLYKGNVVRVGSGFTDEQRVYFWNNPSEIIGRICTVKYKEETKNKQGGISVQFPVFIVVRKDKTEESYN